MWIKFDVSENYIEITYVIYLQKCLLRDGLEHVQTSKGKKRHKLTDHILTMSSTSQTWSPAIDTWTAGNGMQTKLTMKYK